MSLIDDDPFPDPPIPDVDAEGLMVPPWIKFPNIPLGSIGWRMGMGEDYLDRFRIWYRRQSREILQQLWAKYPEIGDWKGFYRREKVEPTGTDDTYVSGQSPKPAPLDYQSPLVNERTPPVTEPDYVRRRE